LFAEEIMILVRGRKRKEKGKEDESVNYESNLRCIPFKPNFPDIIAKTKQNKTSTQNP
jgi:hypothetical protein